MIRDIKIFVDADEEVTFIVEKIENAPSPRVCIVVPDGAALLRSLVGLKLLRKNLIRSEKTGVIATMDREGKRLCALVGLQCVDRIGEINDEIWESAEKLLSTDAPLSLPEGSPEKPESSKEDQPEEAEEIAQPLGGTSQESESDSLMERIAPEPDETQNVEAPEELKEYQEPAGEEAESHHRTEDLSIEFEAGKEISPEDEAMTDEEKPAGDNAAAAGVFAKVRSSVGPVLAKAKTGLISLFTNIKSKISKNKNNKEQRSNDLGEKESSSDEFVVPSERKPVGGVDLMRYQSGARARSRRRVVRTSWAPATLHRPGGTRFDRKGGHRKGAGISGFLGSLKNRLPKGKLSYYIAGGVGGVLLLLMLYLYFIAPSVKVVLFVESQVIAQSITVLGTAEAQAVDTANLKIPLTQHATTEEGSSSAMATGQGVIGEKARGTVSVINNTITPLSIADSATITCISSSCNGLKYKTLGAVTIPAVSVDTIQVEAEQVGANYNISAAQSFKLGTYDPVSEVVIKNLSPFSGGTSESVVIVTKKDRTDLSASFKTSLTEACSSKLRSELGEGTVVIEKSLKTEVSKETFDKSEGEQGDVVNLTMGVSCSALIYRRSDVTQLASEIARGMVTEGYSLNEGSDFIVTETVLSVSGTSAELEIGINAGASPSLDIPALRKSLKGVSLGKANDILDGLTNIKEYRVIYTPDWAPGFLKHIPSKEALINIEIEPAT